MNNTSGLECFRTGIIFSILILASYGDLKRRRIDNRIIFCGWILSFLFHFTGKLPILSGNMHPMVIADYAGGLLLPIGLFWIFIQMGAIGAGDVKLLSVIGAFHGMGFIMQMLFPLLFSGGVLSLFHVLYHNNLLERLYYFRIILRKSMEEKRIVSYKEDLKSREQAAVPFTIAISTAYFLTRIGGLM